MKNIVRLIFLILVLFSCEKKTNIPNKIKIPKKLPVFVDGDSQQALQICPEGFQTIVYNQLIHELQHFLPLNDSIQKFSPRMVFDQKQLEIHPHKQEYCFHFKNIGRKPLIIKQYLPPVVVQDPNGLNILYYLEKKERLLFTTIQKRKELSTGLFG